VLGGGSEVAAGIGGERVGFACSEGVERHLAVAVAGAGG
jgi:hypothetical protein